MKHFFLVILNLTFLSYCQAQGDFAPVGAEWHTKNGWSELWKGGYTYSISEKDTMYKGKDCRKILRFSIEPDGQNGVDSFEVAPLFVYSNSDTVFYYNGLFEQFVPLYIFNVGAGMTVNYHMPFSMPTMPTDSLFPVMVESVTDTLIDGVSLRQVNAMVGTDNYYGMYPNFTYIERIGLLDKQLVPEEEDMHASYNNARLRCYQDAVINFHRFEDIPCDTIPGYTGISELAQQYKNLRLYPNPVQEDWLQLELDSAPGRELQVQVYNINGARVTTMESTGNTQAVRLYVGDLPPGIYQVQVNTEGKVVGKGRFVKR